jgi:hypothetical protein
MCANCLSHISPFRRKGPTTRKFAAKEVLWTQAGFLDTVAFRF